MNTVPDIIASHSDSFYKAFLAESDTAIGLVDEEGKFIYVNETLCLLLGYTPGFLIGLKWQDVTHPEDFEADYKSSKICMNGTINQYRMLKRYRHHKGHYLEAELKVYRVPAEGEFEFFISLIQEMPSIMNLHKIEGEVNKYKVLPSLKDIWLGNKLQVILFIAGFLLLAMLFDDLGNIVSLVEALKK